MNSTKSHRLLYGTDFSSNNDKTHMKNSIRSIISQKPELEDKLQYLTKLSEF